MKKIINNIKEEYQNKDKKVVIVYLILSLLVVVCLIREIINSDIKSVITCTVTLLLFLMPTIIHRKFKITFSSTLEIMRYILVFSSEILGEVLAFYLNIKIFDTILHLLYGFVMAGIGFSLIDILNNNKEEKLNLANKFIILFSICYGVTTGVSWEIFEYGMDKVFKTDMQKDTIITEISSVKLNDKGDNKTKTIEIQSLVVNGEDCIEKYGGYIDIGLNDTMKDIIINLIGAIIFSLVGYSYLKGENKFASNFMLTKEIK